MNFFKQLFKSKPKKIAFLDGDQPLPGMIAAYEKYLKGTETHLVRAINGHQGNDREPKILRGDLGFNKIYLSGYARGKEITDKFIATMSRKSSRKAT